MKNIFLIALLISLSQFANAKTVVCSSAAFGAASSVLVVTENAGSHSIKADHCYMAALRPESYNSIISEGRCPADRQIVEVNLHCGSMSSDLTTFDCDSESGSARSYASGKTHLAVSIENKSDGKVVQDEYLIGTCAQLD